MQSGQKYLFSLQKRRFFILWIKRFIMFHHPLLSPEFRSIVQLTAKQHKTITAVLTMDANAEK
jgi:hypothetical protein